MFEKIFSYPAVQRRHREGLLASERPEYLGLPSTISCQLGGRTKRPVNPSSPIEGRDEYFLTDEHEMRAWVRRWTFGQRAGGAG
jgi:hypothetical protein